MAGRRVARTGLVVRASRIAVARCKPGARVVASRLLLSRQMAGDRFQIAGVRTSGPLRD